MIRLLSYLYCNCVCNYLRWLSGRVTLNEPLNYAFARTHLSLGLTSRSFGLMSVNKWKQIEKSACVARIAVDARFAEMFERKSFFKKLHCLSQNLAPSAFKTMLTLLRFRQWWRTSIDALARFTASPHIQSIARFWAFCNHSEGEKQRAVWKKDWLKFHLCPSFRNWHTNGGRTLRPR